MKQIATGIVLVIGLIAIQNSGAMRLARQVYGRTVPLVRFFYNPSKVSSCLCGKRLAPSDEDKQRAMAWAADTHGKLSFEDRRSILHIGDGCAITDVTSVPEAYFETMAMIPGNSCFFERIALIRSACEGANARPLDHIGAMAAIALEVEERCARYGSDGAAILSLCWYDHGFKAGTK